MADLIKGNGTMECEHSPSGYCNHLIRCGWGEACACKPKSLLQLASSPPPIPADPERYQTRAELLRQRSLIMVRLG